MPPHLSRAGSPGPGRAARGGASQEQRDSRLPAPADAAPGTAAFRGWKHTEVINGGKGLGVSRSLLLYYRWG